MGMGGSKSQGVAPDKEQRSDAFETPTHYSGPDTAGEDYASKVSERDKYRNCGVIFADVV
jgi:hypothetical protein